MGRTQSKKPPQYRLHRRSGRAVVTLTDAITGRRRDVYLGPHGSDESRSAYAAALATWEAAGRTFDGGPAEPGPAGKGGSSVTAVALAFWDSRKRRAGWDGVGRVPRELGHEQQALRVLRSMFGATPATAFGPVRLNAVLEAMVERGWSRATVKCRMGVVKRAFRHALSRELIPASVYTALDLAEPPAWKALGVPAAAKKPPANANDVAAVLPLLPGPLRALLLVVRHTGCRCNEACSLTAGHFEGVSGNVWTVELPEHKGAHRGKVRRLYFNAAAQAAVRPYLHRPDDAPLFSPAESVADARARRTAGRKTPASCGNAVGRRSPGSGRSAKGGAYHPPRDAYTTDSVRQAIYRACDKIGRPRWTAHAVRRLVGSEVISRDGLEAASVVLGHADAKVTAAAYAQRDDTLAKHALRLVDDRAPEERRIG